MEDKYADQITYRSYACRSDHILITCMQIIIYTQHMHTDYIHRSHTNIDLIIPDNSHIDHIHIYRSHAYRSHTNHIHLAHLTCVKIFYH